MLTSQDVVTAYRLLLGRDPESASIVANYVNHSDYDGLRASLLSSSEFAERLSREPDILPMSMVALSTSREVIRYRQLFEPLAAFGLSFEDSSVLLVGEEPASLAELFLERRCLVSVAASAELGRLLQTCVGARCRHAANMTLLSCEFGETAIAATGSYDFVFGQLPDADTDIMRAWLDNTADACAGSLIMLCRVAPGRSEDVFVTGGDAGPQRTVATRAWILSRLRERYKHVFESDRPAGQGAANGESEAIFVASRQALDLPALREATVLRPRPTPAGLSGTTSR